MMAENNGYWTRWLVGTLWVVVWGTILFVGNNVIANDKASRERDDVLEDKLSMCIKEQNTINSQILLQLAKIDNKVDKVQVDLEWVKKAVK